MSSGSDGTSKQPPDSGSKDNVPKPKASPNEANGPNKPQNEPTSSQGPIKLLNAAPTDGSSDPGGKSKDSSSASSGSGSSNSRCSTPSSPGNRAPFRFRDAQNVTLDNCSTMTLDPMDCEERYRERGYRMPNPSTEYHRFYVDQCPRQTLTLPQSASPQECPFANFANAHNQAAMTFGGGGESTGPNNVLLPITPEMAARFRTMGMPSRLYLSPVATGGANVMAYTAMPINLPNTGTQPPPPRATFVIVNANTFNFDTLSLGTGPITVTQTTDLPQFAQPTQVRQTVTVNVRHGLGDHRSWSDSSDSEDENRSKQRSSILSPTYSPPKRSSPLNSPSPPRTPFSPSDDNCQTSVTKLSRRRAPRSH